MRLILSQYLRTLRERGELDALLPILIGEMSYVPITRPQTGTRQFGVDLLAAGSSAEDGMPELLLFVIKQNDIGRREWDSTPQSVRPSLDEIMDVYLQSHVAPEFANHRKVIVVATTGELKEEVAANWAGYARARPDLRFEFWGNERIVGFLERYLLNESLFAAEDWTDLRRALVLAADLEYEFADFCRLLLRQLKLDRFGKVTADGKVQPEPAFVKTLHRVHLAARVCAHWAESDGDTRQAVWVMERTVLWCWHRVVQSSLYEKPRVLEAIKSIWTSYLQVGRQFFAKLKPHVQVRDGLAGGTGEGAEYALVLLEHVGVLASLGLAEDMTDPQMTGGSFGREYGAALAALLRNHDAASSPRLDRNSVDISLALALLVRVRQYRAIHEWIPTLVGRLNFAYASKRRFPIGSDSLDDLAELDVYDDAAQKSELLRTSWMVAVVASWSAMLKIDHAYEELAAGYLKGYPEVGAQLWHPPAEWPEFWYFGPGHGENGATEVPYALPAQAEELRGRIAKFNVSRRLQWEEHSPALAVDLWGIDFVACRHFRIPVPASIWYHLDGQAKGGDDSGCTEVPEPD
jgi:hypothetical protein